MSVTIAIGAFATITVTLFVGLAVQLVLNAQAYERGRR